MIILTINSFDQLYTVYVRFKPWPIRENINPLYIYNEIYLVDVAPPCTNYRTHGTIWDLQIPRTTDICVSGSE